jgi:hypothetical protein
MVSPSAATGEGGHEVPQLGTGVAARAAPTPWSMPGARFPGRDAGLELRAPLDGRGLDRSPDV